MSIGDGGHLRSGAGGHLAIGAGGHLNIGDGGHLIIGATGHGSIGPGGQITGIGHREFAAAISPGLRAVLWPITAAGFKGVIVSEPSVEKALRG